MKLSKKAKKLSTVTNSETTYKSDNDTLSDSKYIEHSDFVDKENEHSNSFVHPKDSDNLHEDIKSFISLNLKVFVAKYASVENCTQALLVIIKNSPVTKTQKIIRYFLKLSNYDIKEIEKLTLDRNRVIRQIAARFIYAYIICKYKESCTYDITSLFKNTFLKRYKDVDPVIRAYSYDFLVDFISLDSKIFGKHKSMLFEALRDRQDVVRKCIIIKLRKKAMYDFENIILEIAKGDRNKNIRLEATKLLLEQSLKNKINFDVIVAVLKVNSGTNKFISAEFDNLLQILTKKKAKESLVDLVHCFLSECSDYINFIDITAFSCNCPVNCYLKALEKQKKCLKLSKLYVMYKNHLNSLYEIIGLLFYAELDNTEILINFIDDLVVNIKHNGDLLQLDKFCEFLKKHENDYESIIKKAINTLLTDKKYKNIIIKYFDIVEYIDENDYFETQVYKNLWNIINENFCDYTEIDIKQYEIFSMVDLCNLVLYVHKLIFTENNDQISHLETGLITEKFTALKLLYFNLLKAVNLDNKACVDILYKFNEEKILEEDFYLVYKHLVDTEEFKEIFCKSKNKVNFINSFFKYLRLCNLETNEIANKIARIINSKFRDTTDRIIFKQIKTHLEFSENYASLDVFVNKLNINECIVLENICKESAFKELLLKRISRMKGMNATEEKTTYL